MKALVVDDSRVTRLAITGILQHQCEFENIEHAEDGEQAVEAVKDGDFDLVLLDWNMPKMLGIDALRAIRESGNTIPVIMVTSERERDHVVRAFDTGANDYIVKPFNAKSVGPRILEALERASHTPDDHTSYKALVADDSSVMRKILTGILQNQCRIEDVVQVEDGEAAVEAAKAGNFDLVLLDWNMPKMLGIDALRAIRKARRKTPIIMVTSEKEGARVVEAFDAGANNYIIKPFEPVAAGEKVNQVLAMYA